MLDTVKGSYFSEILPEGWDIAKFMECVSNDPASVCEPQSFWNKDFTPVQCDNLSDFDVLVTNYSEQNEELIEEIRATGMKVIVV